MANNRLIVSLQELPIEVLTVIVGKVGKNSSADYCNTRATCRRMLEASNDPMIFRSLCLKPLMKKPLKAYAHMEIVEKCIEEENYAAYFIQGIHTYFVSDNIVNGLAYLELSAIGDGDDLIPEAAYLYGVLKIIRGDEKEGKKFMDILNWHEDDDLKATNAIWKNLRKSLHGIPVTKKNIYFQYLENRKPPDSCHLRDLDIVCDNCFYYKMAVKFYHMLP